MGREGETRGLTWCFGACVGAGTGGACVFVVVLADLARNAPPAKRFPHARDVLCGSNASVAPSLCWDGFGCLSERVVWCNA